MASMYDLIVPPGASQKKVSIFSNCSLLFIAINFCTTVQGDICMQLFSASVAKYLKYMYMCITCIGPEQKATFQYAPLPSYRLTPVSFSNRPTGTADELRQALVSGRNVFIHGGAGSGKTTAINEYVVRILREKHGIVDAEQSASEYIGVSDEDSEETDPEIWVCSTTGISAMNLRTGCTIYSIAGLGLANGSLANVLDRMPQSARKRWRKVVAIIIDESSMFSAMAMNMLDQVARFLKGNNHAMGNVQVVLVGDLFQLPPVRKLTMLSPGRYKKFFPGYVFEAECWHAMQFVHFRLQGSQRHRGDDEYANFLHMLSSFVVSSNTTSGDYMEY